MSKHRRLKRYWDNEYIRHTLSGEVSAMHGTSPRRPGNDMGSPRSQRGNTGRLILAFWEQERNMLVVRSPLRKSRKKCIPVSIWNTIKFAGQLMYAGMVMGMHMSALERMDEGGHSAG